MGKVLLWTLEIVALVALVVTSTSRLLRSTSSQIAALAVFMVSSGTSFETMSKGFIHHQYPLSYLHFSLYFCNFSTPYLLGLWKPIGIEVFCSIFLRIETLVWGFIGDQLSSFGFQIATAESHPRSLAPLTCRNFDGGSLACGRNIIPADNEVHVDQQIPYHRGIPKSIYSGRPDAKSMLSAHLQPPRPT